MTDHVTINLAKGLSTIILTNTEASAAVDHWISQNAALEELEKQHAWMRPSFTELAQFSLNTSNFGLYLRVFGGALLSMFDLITDIYMTYLFFNTDGQEFYGQVNAWLIGLTIFLQILLSNFQNTKKSNFLRDALYGFRPALDAYRVGSGAEKEDHQVVEPLAEMSACKYVEVAFGTIPALHVQIFAILRANDQKVDALISILVSAATIGFTSSMISYDWDLSPTNRANNPLFCGYIPDSALKRAACFFSMMWLTVSRRSVPFPLLVLFSFHWAGVL
ncbi:hypothetical protein TL16_g08518 [Triparma laevis f. inornata]|uniref:Uncharacterized protein n=1 Tax=Triparma laevis f. inornata TaxID=1714386 RepID=A0A9W7AYG5_9STRA|nr:hypothetical protein TL16_g08518 [Triparma laevis f. inornata]